MRLLQYDETRVVAERMVSSLLLTSLPRSQFERNNGLRMATLEESWPTGLQSLSYTIHLRASDLDWSGLKSAANGVDRFRVDGDSVRASLRADAADGDYHGHLYIERTGADEFSLELSIGRGALTGVRTTAPDIRSIPQFLRPFIKSDLADLRGILLVYFQFPMEFFRPLVALPLTPPESVGGPVIAGFDFEFPDSSPILRRSYLGRFTEAQLIKVWLMLRIPVEPTASLLERLLTAAASYVQAYVEALPGSDPATIARGE